MVGSVNPATVAPALDNRTAINAVYQALGEQGLNAMTGVDGGALKWETPTGHALKRVATTLAAFNPNPAGRKYVFLLTSGDPDTCLVRDPQCGQDLAVKAAQDARVLGITTLILGLGDAASGALCDSTNQPCGVRHLQDMANAGSAQPVETPPPSYWYQQCPYRESNTSPGTPRAAYAPVGMGGTAEFYSGTSRAELRAELMDMFEHVVTGVVP
jgi:hypothetical protein